MTGRISHANCNKAHETGDVPATAKSWSWAACPHCPAPWGTQPCRAP